MILLGLNIDHCATLRQARYREAAATCGGAVEARSRGARARGGNAPALKASRCICAKTTGTFQERERLAAARKHCHAPQP